MCLGSWGLLAYRAVAQDETIQNAAVRDDLVSPSNVEKLIAEKEALVVPTVSNPKIPVAATDKYLQLNPQGLSSQLLSHGDGSDNTNPMASENGGRDGVEATQTPDDEVDNNDFFDDELGVLRVRSRPVGTDSELGILRVRPTEDAPLEQAPEPNRQASVFLTGRANVFGGNNLFRTSNPIDDRIYQAGIGIFAFPNLSDDTNLVLSAEANLARYEDLSVVDFNELQFQAGIRQRLGQRSFGQINWAQSKP